MTNRFALLRELGYKFFCLSTALLGSCTAYHSGTMSMSMPAPTSHSQIVTTAVGTAKASYFLGMGGFDRQGLALEAKRNLYRNYPLLPMQIYANATVDSKRSYYLIYCSHKVTVSADIVDYDSSRTKVSASKWQASSHTATSMLPDQISRIKVGDTVAVFKRTADNNTIIGTILNIDMNTVTVGVQEGTALSTVNALLENIVPLRSYQGGDTYSRFKIGQLVAFKNNSEPIGNSTMSGIVKNVVGDLYLVEYLRNNKKTLALYRDKNLYTHTK